MGDYGYYEIPWVFMGVWINMSSEWVYLCVFISICEFVRFYGSLWRAMGMGPKGP